MLKQVDKDGKTGYGFLTKKKLNDYIKIYQKKTQNDYTKIRKSTI